MRTTDKQVEECELVRRLLEILRIAKCNLNSNDRPDVLATVNNRSIGIEVTVLHPDEGQNSNRGSIQRKTEEEISRKANGNAYGMWGVVNSLPALVLRIKDKIERAKSYNNQGFNELWLLIAASVPQLGAVASTYIYPCALSSEDLNNHTDEILRASQFSKVYLHLILGHTLYEWSHDKKWHVLQAPPAASHGAELWFKPILRNPEWLRDPRGKARSEMRKALEEWRALQQPQVG